MKSLEQKETNNVEISILDIALAINLYRNFFISFSLLGFILGWLALNFVTPLYTSDIVVISNSNEESSNELNALGGLASFAGIQFPSKERGSASAIEILKSRTFKKSFIEKFNIKPILFPQEWKSENNSWNGKEPSDLGSVSMLDEIMIIKKAESGLITIFVTTPSAENSQNIANNIINYINQFMRERKIKESEESIVFLKQELSKSSVSGIRDSIFNLIEKNLSDKTFANVNEDFAFQIIDKAEFSNSPSYPNKLQFQIIGLVLGAIFSFFVIIYLSFIKEKK